MSVLEAKNLTKKFSARGGGDFAAVNNISFSLKEGEILGLLGPNGAGKTTTMQMLLGILIPTSGEVRYFGKSLKDHREEIMEQVNFSSTYTNLPWNLTVKEVLVFVSYLYKIENRRQRIEAVAETFKLGEFLKKRVSHLSAGQLTRVNLAKAFINFPKICLFDEPTASLDPVVAQYIREFILEEQRRSGISVILTSHNMREVERVCDRVLFINEGRIVANDTPANLARTVEKVDVELHIPDGFSGALRYAKKRGLSHSIEGRYLTLTAKEKEVPGLLRDLMDQGIAYDEISIREATLEDYFLEVMKVDSIETRVNDESGYKSQN